MAKKSLSFLIVMIMTCMLFAGSVFAENLTESEIVSENETTDTLQTENIEQEETTGLDEEMTTVETGSLNEEMVPEETASETENTSEEEGVNNLTVEDDDELETDDLTKNDDILDKNDLDVKKIANKVLEYDDRYDFSKLLSGTKSEYADYEIAYIETTGEVESYKVANGNVSSQKDENVLIELEAQKVCATGIGTATVYFTKDENIDTVEKVLKGETVENYTDEIPETLSVTVEVNPAALTIMYLAGQSNMEGKCSENTGFQRDYSIANTEGEVYSTYAPSTAGLGKNITGISGIAKGTISNAESKVAGALGYTGNNKSINGKTLKYPIYALTSSGNGKTGPDSALAYKWNSLTGDKVWIVNTACSSSSVKSWTTSGSNYKRALAYFSDAKKTYLAEIASGHYKKGHSLMFWLQGETDNTMTSANYEKKFLNSMASLKSKLGLEKIGVMVCRANTDANKGKQDVWLTGTRAAQYAICANSGYSYINMVNNSSDSWTSDSKVKKYFASAYKTGYLNYPIRNAKGKKLPTKESQIHSDIHYSQIGHNQNGLNAATNMYKLIYKSGGSAKASSAYWVNSSYNKTEKIGICIGNTVTVASVIKPSYGKVTVSANNKHASYDAKTGTIEGKSKGKTKLTIKSGGKTLATLTVVVSASKNFSKTAGKKTGLYNYYGTLYYLTKGKVNKKFEGLAKYKENLYYVKNGTVDNSVTGAFKYKTKKYLVLNGVVTKTFTGFRKINNKWFYIKKGVFSKATTIEKGTVNKTTGYWLIINGKVSFSTTVAQKANTKKWYYVNNGKVDFTYTGPACNSKGWWYIEKGKLNTGYTGFTTTSTGVWYVKKGYIDLKLTSVVKVGSTSWYIKKGRVADYSGKLRVGKTVYIVKNGKIAATES